ncbi:hypothetical protein [Mucilaginibacter endophyticus]|uniref:hypothetical protein n=1 Tax=Mucilaginibacter endophyticus TaxID=2675003 RepID=UPI00137979F6|nr:hypothetical protein [Mucilaginibacter endophyticus]
MKNLILIIFSLACSLLILGCQSDPYAGDMTTEQPRREDIIGIYRFKEQTISEAPIDKRGLKATITLKSDGTYLAIDIPNVFGGPDAENHKYISAKGNWKIETIGSIDTGWGHPKPNWGITLTAIDESLTNIGFTGNETPYGLIVTFDDPDLAMVMLFKKIR